MPNPALGKSIHFLRGVIYGLAFFLGCIITAFLVWRLFGIIGGQTGGRDFCLIGAIAAVLIGAATFGLSVKNRLTVEQMFVALLILETPVIGLIGFYTGSYAVNRLTVSWFLGINLYIALPWAMGQIISALVKNRRVT